MKHKQENLWSAYLDGQLSAKESAEFDDSLTPDERGCLAREIHWEACLANALASNSECPDAVWKGVRSKIVEKSKKKRSVRLFMFAPHLWKLAAVAAVIVVAFIFLLSPENSTYEDCLAAPHNLEAMTAKLDVSGDLGAVRQFLQKQDFDISLGPVPSTEESNGHERILLGARAIQERGETVIELLYSCCGEPLKMILARTGTAIANRAKSSMPGIVQATRRVGDFQIALVGRHEAKSLMQVFGEM